MFSKLIYKRILNYEWSDDEYDDLDEEVRDKYVVYCEPAKNYKMRQEMDW